MRVGIPRADFPGCCFRCHRDGFQVFGITPVGDADAGDLPLFCHVHSLLLLHNGIVGKLIACDPAALFHQTDDALRIRSSLGDLIQCVFDEIVFFHITTPFAVVFEVERDNMQVQYQSQLEIGTR